VLVGGDNSANVLDRIRKDDCRELSRLGDGWGAFACFFSHFYSRATNDPRACRHRNGSTTVLGAKHRRYIGDSDITRAVTVCIIYM
jgi:hypothetical protein